MSSALTPDQITALAPDAASLKAGRDLGAPRKWALLGGDAEVLWGLAQGSGQEPYQTRVALADLATKCSCPSRKFPCKHALGLLFIAAGHGAALTDKTRPPWVVEWLDSRAARQEKSRERAEQAAVGVTPPVDAAAKAKREEKREARVEEGAALLRQWLADLVKKGLADASPSDPATWDDILRRMVDAQAGGLARRLRRAASVARSGPGWETRLLAELGRLHLLLCALASREHLEPALRAEIEQQVGWTVTQEQVLTGPSLQDTWLVAARTVQVQEEDRLVTTETWLRGTHSGRWALLLRNSPLVQPAVDTWPPGRSLHGELCFYPGVEPLRALWRGEPQAASPGEYLATAAHPPEETFTHLLERHAASLALNPWHYRTLLHTTVRPLVTRHDATLADATGAILPLRADADTRELLLALSGGHPVRLTLRWDGEVLEPLTIVEGTEWVPLTRQRLDP